MTGISSRLGLSNRRQDTLDHRGMSKYKHSLQTLTKGGFYSFLEQNLILTRTPRQSSTVEVPKLEEHPTRDGKFTPQSQDPDTGQ